MGFWLRKTIFGAILIIIAVVSLSNLDFFFKLKNDLFDSPAKVNIKPSKLEQTTPAKGTSTPPSKKPDTKTIDNNSNAAAVGLSNFYASINPSLSTSGPKVRHGVVFLPEPTGNLETLLSARAKVMRPFPESWQGDKQNRPFRKNHTLYQKLDEYAKQQGLELVWWLNKDLLIKDPFRINKEILATAFQIGQAMSGHFQNGVFTYFCYKQRSIVLVEGKHKYLDKHCRLLNYNQY